MTIALNHRLTPDVRGLYYVLWPVEPKWWTYGFFFLPMVTFVDVVRPTVQPTGRLQMHTGSFIMFLIYRIIYIVGLPRFARSEPCSWFWRYDVWKVLILALLSQLSDPSQLCQDVHVHPVRPSWFNSPKSKLAAQFHSCILFRIQTVLDLHKGSFPGTFTQVDFAQVEFHWVKSENKKNIW